MPSGTREICQGAAVRRAAETLLSLRSGRDFRTSYAMDNADGSTDVFFDPGSCDGDQDIQKVTYP